MPMCFYTQQTKTAVQLENRFQARIKNPELTITDERINGFTFPKTPVITHKETSIIQHFNWGLIPFWAQDDAIRKFTLNAKIETLHEKPSFKNVLNNRCLIPADGFFEWQWLDSKGTKKQPYLITLPEHELFSFAGIWSEWLDKKTGELINTYSIITTAANKFMAEIHNSKKRMPVILTEKSEKNWLDQDSINLFKEVDLAMVAHKI